MAKSPKKPRRGGEHDPAVNTAAGAPSKGVSVDPAVNTAADAPSMGVSVDPRRTRFTVEVGPPHGYEGGGSGRSHPENADPDQQVAKG